MAAMDHRARLTELYAGHWRAIFGYAGRRCGSAADAADVVSEVFLVAWRRIDDAPTGAEATLWLYGIAHRTLANQLRGVRRRDRLGSALLAEIKAVGADPTETIDRIELSDAVRSALARLPAIDREIVTLVGWEGLTPAEAAAVLGISPVAARTRLSRARTRFAALLPFDPVQPVKP